MEPMDLTDQDDWNFAVAGAVASLEELLGIAKDAENWVAVARVEYALERVQSLAVAQMRVLDLFAGLEGWSAPFRDRGHEVCSTDIEERFDVDIHADILELTPADLPWRPDLVLASPPCEGFTVMNIGRNWTGPKDIPAHAPKTESAWLALKLVQRTRWLIRGLDPAFFVIENPVAKLRKLPVVADLPRRTVHYCHWGETTMKPTDLWGAFPPSLDLGTLCHTRKADHPEDCCCRDHAAAPRGSRTPGSIQGVQGKGNDAIRAKVPYQLSKAVCLAVESDLGGGAAVEDQGTLFG